MCQCGPKLKQPQNKKTLNSAQCAAPKRGRRCYQWTHRPEALALSWAGVGGQTGCGLLTELEQGRANAA